MSSQVVVDQARVHIEGTTATSEEMETTGDTAVAALQGNQAVAGAPAVGVALGTFVTANTALATNNATKKKYRALWEQAVTDEPPLMRRWLVQKQGLENSMTAFADGSKDVAASFHTGVAERVPSPDAVVPVNLRPMKKSVPTIGAWRWDPTPGCIGYLVRTCTNPNDGTTVSAPRASSKARYYLPGQVPGATIFAQVLALDPKLPAGQTAYSAWVSLVITG